MRWSWTVARIRGINVDIHATFLLLLAWIALASYGQSHTTGAAVTAVALTLVIFASVVLHEFGHAFVAAHFGIKTRSITLLPIGGVAHIERMPERPRQELAIALAGPAVTVAIVVLLYAALRLTGHSTAAGASMPAPWSFAAQTMWVNVVLAVFNLLPAFPMDGGRVLRAALAMRMSFARATELAARTGKVFALLFALAGLFVVNNPFLVVIAAFVWLSAAAEANAAQLKDTVGDVHVSQAMITDVRSLEPGQPVSVAIDEVRSGFQHDFPIVSDHVVAGMLTREDLLSALAHGRADAPVADVMHRDFAATTPDESLERALERLRECHCRTLPVMRGREVVGLLTAEKISEFVLIASAARTGRHAA
ncbi:MAG: site-2 protease family protein [Gemmatimonadaceae bacterium]